jgi:threonine dehydrogenase-like Zn-dependent dehydrogenase
MKQLKAFGPKDLRVVETEEPRINSEYNVLLDIHACGICGSDKWYWSVKSPAKKVAGHEVAGRVIAVGEGVRHVKVGDRVAVNNVKGCGYCGECSEGRYVRCANGITHIGGGFSERIAVPEANCLLLDDDTGYVEGSLIFDNWGTPYAAIQRAGIKQGDSIAVIGCGPIGLAAVALSTAIGARVLAIDPIPERLAAAAKMGAKICLSPTEVTQEAVRRFSLTDGVDGVLECSGKSSSYDLAGSMVRIGGVVAAIGEGAAIQWSSSTLIHKHLTLVGSLYSSMRDGQEIQRMMRSGIINPIVLVTHQFTMEQLPYVFGDIVECRNGIIKAVMVRENEGKEDKN